MKKVRPVVARNARELAKVLGLSPADGMEIEFRSDLNDKIIEVVAKKGLTHSDVARLAHTSRTRVTIGSTSYLESAEHVTQQNVSDQLSMDKMIVSDVVKTLEKRNFLTRK